MTITFGGIRANVTGRRAFGVLRAEAHTASEAERPEVHFLLSRDAVMSFQPDRAQTNMEVRCLSGALWLTQEGDSVDYFLKADETFRPQPAGRIVVQAMSEDTTVSLG